MAAVVFPGLGHAMAQQWRQATAWFLGLLALGFFSEWVLIPFGFLPFCVSLFLSLLALVAVGWSTAKSASLAREQKVRPLRRRWILVFVVLASALDFWSWSTRTYESYRIPSGSMVPAILPGEQILAKRVPETHALEPAGIYVFRYPRDPSIFYIKRLIAGPGQSIGFGSDAMPTIDRKPVAFQPVGRISESPDEDAFRSRVGGREFVFLRDPQRPGVSSPEERTLGSTEYFALGDHRDHSSDSRVWGPVERSAVVAESMFVVWSWDAERGRVRWERLGAWVK